MLKGGEMNREVLKVLEYDARATAGQIATMTGLSARQVRKTIEEAEEICKTEMTKGNGSDIWVGSDLYKTYIYNPFTGKFEIS